MSREEGPVAEGVAVALSWDKAMLASVNASNR